jgi:hypothetical protein
LRCALRYAGFQFIRKGGGMMKMIWIAFNILSMVLVAVAAQEAFGDTFKTNAGT